jgi:fatty-acyl-CoA synthase
MGRMAIKIGFSSMACPGWDLKTLFEAAKLMGFDGIELRGLGGFFHLPESPELADDPAAAVRLSQETGVKLACLGSSAAFESPDRKTLQHNRQLLGETLALAGRLQCPFVRVFLGNAHGWETRGSLSRVAAELRELAPIAAHNRTTILVENGGDFLVSEDLWFVLDAVSHPNVRACWNPLNALIGNERPTVSLKRLGRMMDVFRLIDGNFDEQGRFLGYAIPGQGMVELARAIENLRGICFQGWLMFEWPKVIVDLPEPEEVLPTVLAFARHYLSLEHEVLSAYKGDKNAPKFFAEPSYVPPAAK